MRTAEDAPPSTHTRHPQVQNRERASFCARPFIFAAENREPPTREFKFRTGNLSARTGTSESQSGDKGRECGMMCVFPMLTSVEQQFPPTVDMWDTL